MEGEAEEPFLEVLFHRHERSEIEEDLRLGRGLVGGEDLDFAGLLDEKPAS